MPVIALVVATAKDRVIGKDGHLPWRNQRSDRRFFRKVTLGKPVVMGRRTHDSIGRVLDKRTNIVLTRNRDYIVPGAVTYFGALFHVAVQGQNCNILPLISKGSLKMPATPRNMHATYDAACPEPLIGISANVVAAKRCVFRAEHFDAFGLVHARVVPA